jgi:hypothetical protein
MYRGAAVDAARSIAPDTTVTPDGTGTPDSAAAENPAPEAGLSPRDALSSRDLEILEFERQWWRLPGAKEQAIRDRFGLSSTRYHQLLNTLLDSPAALRADPLLVRRLQRLRSSRERSRSAGRLGREA